MITRLPLSIGFDAKRLYHNFTGLGNYSRTLLQTLAAVRPDWQYHLFTPKINPHSRLQFLHQIPHLSVHTPPKGWTAMPATWRRVAMSRDIRRSGVDIYHGLSHELPVGLSDSGIRTAVTMHDLIFERFPAQYPWLDRKIYRWKFKQACRQADRIVAISEQTKADLIEFYKVPAHKIQVIYQSCDPIFRSAPDDTYKDSVRQRYGLPGEFLLYVGSVIERKNLLAIVQALHQLTAFPTLPLVVVGNGGAYLRKVRDYIASKGLQKRIFWFKTLDFNDLPVFYHLAHALVLPSLFEGFGIPIIESLNCGTPVITSTGSCFAETAGPGASYVDPHDTGDIARAMQQVMEDSALHSRLSQAGSRYVRRFDPEVVGIEWVSLYQALIEGTVE